MTETQQHRCALVVLAWRTVGVPSSGATGRGLDRASYSGPFAASRARTFTAARPASPSRTRPRSRSAFGSGSPDHVLQRAGTSLAAIGMWRYMRSPCWSDWTRRSLTARRRTERRARTRDRDLKARSGARCTTSDSRAIAVRQSHFSQPAVRQSASPPGMISVELSACGGGTSCSNATSAPVRARSGHTSRCAMFQLSSLITP